VERLNSNTSLAALYQRHETFAIWQAFCGGLFATPRVAGWNRIRRGSVCGSLVRPGPGYT
jgi:hypothetical protein